MRRLYNFLSSSKRRKLRNRRKLYINNRAGRLRISVYKSNRNFYVQLFDDEKGITITSASTLDPKIRGMCKGKVNTKTIEYVSSLMIERLSNIGSACRLVFDRGPYKYKGLVSQFADALRSSGIKF